MIVHERKHPLSSDPVPDPVSHQNTFHSNRLWKLASPPLYRWESLLRKHPRDAKANEESWIQSLGQHISGQGCASHTNSTAKAVEMELKGTRKALGFSKEKDEENFPDDAILLLITNRPAF